MDQADQTLTISQIIKRKNKKKTPIHKIQKWSFLAEGLSDKG